MGLISSPLFIVVVVVVVVADVQTIDLLTVENVCVVGRFNNKTLCDSSVILDAFAAEKFKFRNPTHLNRFGVWLKALYSMQHFAPDTRLMATVARFVDRMVLVVDDIKVPMQQASVPVYRNAARLFADHMTVADMDQTFRSFQNLFNSYIIWSPSLYKTMLGAYARVRARVHQSRRFVADVDDACVRLVTLTLQYPLTLARADHVRQDAYVYYVSRIENAAERKRFGGIYETVENLQFPQTTTLHCGPVVNVTLHHSIDELSTLNRMQNEVDYVYDNFKKLYARLNLTVSHSIRHVDMYVYRNKTEYERTGLLYADSVDNGGVTMYRTIPHSRVVASVYFDNEDQNDNIPNAFGHELFHCLQFTSNRRITFDSRWFVEGAANRFGFRQCFWKDHYNLRANINATIAEIVRADYDTQILYPMGSALVAFLYEKRPDILRHAVLSRNYSIASNALLEYQFAQFKNNKLRECQYKNQQSSSSSSSSSSPPTTMSKTTLQRYLGALSRDTFAVCKNYIVVDFRTCAFIMTPDRLIKFDKPHDNRPLNVQHEIRFNDVYVSSFDYEYFEKGLIKLIVRLSLNDTDDPHAIADKYFSVDTNYSYRANVSCSMAVTPPLQALIDFTLKSPTVKMTALARVGNLNVTSMVRRFELGVIGCRTFMVPPPGDSGRSLRNFIDRVEQLPANQHIADANLVKPIDAYNNTILHLIAIHNRNMYIRIASRMNSTATKNAYGQTPQWMYENTVRYLKAFKHSPSRYCTTILPIETTTTKTTTTMTSSTQAPLEMINKSIEYNLDRNNLLIVTLGSIVLILGIVLIVNTLIIIRLVRQNTANKKTNSSLYNKTKFYKNNECTIRLFE
ncbi:hypothetical protein [Alphabaculovirus myunipunctae]|uniref:Uncharacterized protein n=1 Tax=Mythimna unipuncta nucleopolyhedrovirus TaxID=447897 RepID=A0A2K9VS57_9ABAC|nr:hypothetical protein [Mythimna unipuncta nucleopolyhedrovirus]AUV65291.1 hypothetical protein [Mythimna unipuncta nucleopolyhedrovirus]